MSSGKVVLFGGPAGAGKSTLARLWCAEQDLAVHLQLDDIRQLIVSGLADPQRPDDPRQPEQYSLAVAGCCALARLFADAGYDVAVDDVLEPDAFEQDWMPLLDGLDWRVVIVLPTLTETLARSAAREKRVMEEHTRRQYELSAQWPSSRRVDTTGLTIDASLEEVRRVIDG